MPDIRFPDLSNFQPDVTWPALRKACGVVAEQISWGTALTIPAGRRDAIRAQGFDIVVWYMGLVASQPVAAQVEAFAGALGPLQPNETIAVDWEATGSLGTPPAAMRDQALDALAAKYAVPATSIGTYGGAADLAANPAPSGWVWAASYETGEPAVAHVLWQYTNGSYVSLPASTYGPVHWPGVGSIDTSVFHGDLAAMKAALLAPPPDPPAPPATYPEENMKAQSVPVQIVGGHGWVPSPVPAGQVVNVVAFDENPENAGRYDQVPTFQGIATQASTHAPNGALVFEGSQDGTFGALIWSVTA